MPTSYNAQDNIPQKELSSHRCEQSEGGKPGSKLWLLIHILPSYSHTCETLWQEDGLHLKELGLKSRMVARAHT